MSEWKPKPNWRTLERTREERLVAVPKFKAALELALVEAAKPRELQKTIVYDRAYLAARMAGMTGEFGAALDLPHRAMRVFQQSNIYAECETPTMPWIEPENPPREAKPPRQKKERPKKQTREEYLASVRKPKAESIAKVRKLRLVASIHQILLAGGGHAEVLSILDTEGELPLKPESRKKTAQRWIGRVVRLKNLPVRSHHRPSR